MAWQERVATPSYKGFVLNIKNHKFVGGKKGKDSDYSNQDGGSSEDLGPKQRKLSVVGFIGGANYDLEKNDLEEILNDRGVGELVLPNNEKINCLAIGWSFSTGWLDGAGIWEYTIDFVEIKQSNLPQQETKVTCTDLNSDKVLDSLSETTEDIPKATLLDKLNAFLDDVQQAISGVLDPLTIAARAIVNDLLTTAEKLNPEVMFASVIALQRSIIDGEKNLKNAVRNLKMAWERASNEISNLLDSAENRKNQHLVVEASGAASIVSASESLLDGEYQNSQEAIESSYEILVFYEDYRKKMFEIEMSWDADDESPLLRDKFSLNEELLYELLKMVNLVSEELERRAFSLPGKITHVTENPTNAINLCFDLFGDIDDLEKLVDDNGILDPAYIPAGKKIIYSEQS